MRMSNTAIFIFAFIAIVITVFIISYVLKKNRRDLQELKAELKQEEDREP